MALLGAQVFVANFTLQFLRIVYDPILFHGCRRGSHIEHSLSSSCDLSKLRLNLLTPGPNIMTLPQMWTTLVLLALLSMPLLWPSLVRSSTLLSINAWLGQISDGVEPIHKVLLSYKGFLSFMRS